MAGEPSRQLILWTLAMTLLTVVIGWALFEIRQVLLLLYVSGLLAVGFSPLVRAIERQRLVPVGTKLPRWFAILVLYLAIIGLVIVVVLLTVPPLVRQAEELAKQLPAQVHRWQQWLLASGLIEQEITWRDAIEQAPGGGEETLGPVLVAVSGVRRWDVRRHHDVDSYLLPVHRPVGANAVDSWAVQQDGEVARV